MSIKKYFKYFPLFFFVAFIGLTTTANAVPIGTDAEVLTAVTVTAGADLDFGSFTTAGAGGTIDFPAGGTISVGGGDPVLLGGEVGGTTTLDTTGSGASPITVNLTATLLVSGGNNMTLVPDCLPPAPAVLGVNSCTFTGIVNAAETVQIGGTLTVGAGQAAGVYAGTIDVVAGF